MQWPGSQALSTLLTFWSLAANEPVEVIQSRQESDLNLTAYPFVLELRRPWEPVHHSQRVYRELTQEQHFTLTDQDKCQPADEGEPTFAGLFSVGAMQLLLNYGVLSPFFPPENVFWFWCWQFLAVKFIQLKNFSIVFC